MFDRAFGWKRFSVIRCGSQLGEVVGVGLQWMLISQLLPNNLENALSHVAVGMESLSSVLTVVSVANIVVRQCSASCCANVVAHQIPNNSHMSNAIQNSRGVHLSRSI